MNKMNLIMILLSCSLPLASWAQKTGDADLDIIELELDRPVEQQAPPSESAQSVQAKEARAEGANAADAPLTDFKGLGKLASFSEVSVIQKKYMPKTGRFQFYLGPALVTNDPFFNTIGGEIKAGYFLTETWGVEFNYFALTTSERDSTKELRSIQGVSTVNLVYPKSYMGLDLMFVPVYGKMTWFNKTIVPFDLYFSAGYGTTNTQAGENAGTVHLAAGQIFSFSKGLALRWDFSWNFYSASGIDSSSGANPSGGTKSSFNNLFLSVGASFFFPEVNYR